MSTVNRLLCLFMKYSAVSQTHSSFTNIRRNIALFRTNACLEHENKM